MRVVRAVWRAVAGESPEMVLVVVAVVVLALVFTHRGVVVVVLPLVVGLAVTASVTTRVRQLRRRSGAGNQWKGS